MKMKKYAIAMTVLSVALAALFLTACGEQELSFGEERFYGLKTAEEMSFARERERPVQIAVGESRVWTLTTAMGDCVYERELKMGSGTGDMRSLEWQQGEGEWIMGISAMEDCLYVSVSCGETVQVRKIFGTGKSETVLSIPWEEAPEQIQPTMFFVDQTENAYFATEDEVWRYSPEEGSRTVYRLKEPAVFLQEKEPGIVEAVAKSGNGIALYTLREDGKAEKRWSLKLSTSRLTVIQTDDDTTLVLAVDDRVLFVDSGTGEIVYYFDSIAAGVSTDLLGGLCLVEEGTMYLAERNASYGVLWEGLAAQSGPEGDRTVLVYGTVSLSEAIQERIVSFNKTNRDYYITVEEYGSGDPWAGKLQLQAALTSGHGPDIVDLYNIDNYIPYAEKGYLEDLEPYLRGEDFCDDILWQVQDLYRVDGKLCMLVPHFSVWALAIHPAYAQDVENWDYDSFLKLVESNRKEKHVVAGGSARAILSTLFQGLQGEFLDREEKKAHFDSPEFVSLLKLCKENAKESFMASNVGYGHDEVVDKVLLGSELLNDPMGCMGLYAYYGEDALPYGYPTRDGQVFLVKNNIDACGISSVSGNKDGAWEFLRTLYEEDFQVRRGGLNVSWGIRESCWYKMWEPYMSQSTMGFNGIMIDPPTKEDVALFGEALLQGRLTADLVDYGITELVLEEADVYFSGDASAEEAAEKIQNRVQLMLEE